MESYKVGQVIPNFIGHREETKFDIDNSGAIMLVFFKNPTQEEINQFDSENHFEIRYIKLKNVIMLTAKVGNLNWIDFPYTPHLSKNLISYSIPQHDNQGLALTVIFVDAVSGEIKKIRLLGLSGLFTKKLLGEIIEEKMNVWDEVEYRRNIQKIFEKYNTKELVKMSSNYCKFN